MSKRIKIAITPKTPLINDHLYYTPTTSNKFFIKIRYKQPLRSIIPINNNKRKSNSQIDRRTNEINIKSNKSSIKLKKYTQIHLSPFVNNDASYFTNYKNSQSSFAIKNNRYNDIEIRHLYMKNSNLKTMNTHSNTIITSKAQFINKGSPYSHNKFNRSNPTPLTKSIEYHKKNLKVARNAFQFSFGLNKKNFAKISNGLLPINQ